jgi:peptidyl-prolyl cis-trans isomerase SurA
MLKTSTLIFFFVTLCFSNILYANENYKIITKINDKIISNHDVDKEKRYLSALNPEMLNISEEEILKISKQSLIREIIKEKEVSKFYKIDYQATNLIELTKNLYTRLDINSEEDFKNYLKKYELKLEDVTRKLAIEINWNQLIYEKYKDIINIDRDKIRKNLELEDSTPNKEKKFLLSEILFTAKDQAEYENDYKKIIDTIKEKGFSSAATIYSSSDTAKFGGEIGWVGKNDISKKIYKHVSNLQINEVSKPIKIGAGFLLLNLNDVKEEERKNNLEERYNNIVTAETNRQLNQHSTIFYKKIKLRSFIYDN